MRGNGSGSVARSPSSAESSNGVACGGGGGSRRMAVGAGGGASTNRGGDGRVGGGSGSAAAARPVRGDGSANLCASAGGSGRVGGGGGGGGGAGSIGGSVGHASANLSSDASFESGGRSQSPATLDGRCSVPPSWHWSVEDGPAMRNALGLSDRAWSGEEGSPGGGKAADAISVSPDEVDEGGRSSEQSSNRGVLELLTTTPKVGKVAGCCFCCL